MIDNKKVHFELSDIKDTSSIQAIKLALGIMLYHGFPRETANQIIESLKSTGLEEVVHLADELKQFESIAN